MSAISSRKIVPPLACSKRPMRVLTAWVKAPRSCPKSSLSSNSSGMAAQFTGTRVPLAAMAVVMQGPGDELLAGAGFPEEQHGGIGVGHFADKLEKLSDGLTLCR